MRYAFDLAERRRRKLTLVHKTNVLVHAGGMWQRIVNAVASEHPGVAVDYLHVDAATIFLVTNPSRFDVIVTDNLFGDILTDLAGAVTGGIGLAASGNINPDGAFPSISASLQGRDRARIGVERGRGLQRVGQMAEEFADRRCALRQRAFRDAGRNRPCRSPSARRECSA